MTHRSGCPQRALLTRTIAAAAAALLIVVGLSAPAGGTPTDPATDPGPTPTSPAPEPAPTADPTPDPTPEPEPTTPTELPSTIPGTGAVPEAGEGVAVTDAPQSTVLAAPAFAAPLRPGVYRMTSPQGPRCAPTINASLAHMGQDMAAPLGTPIFAVAAGIVRFAGPEPTAGQWIVIEHVVDGRTVTSAYSHSRNATEFVRTGDRVAAGQRIASVGSTGVSTGPHLHLEIWEGKYGTAAGGTVVNPDSWLAARGVSLRAGATSVYEPRVPSSCTYWALGTTKLYASPSSTAAVVTTVLSGTVLTTPGVGVKTNRFIQVTTPRGVVAWAPAGQVSPQRVAPASGYNGVLDRDLTGDGFADVLAVDGFGRLRLYVSNGAGGWSTSRQVGSGWRGVRLVAANDFTGDGRADVFGIDATGRLHLYPGKGDGTFRSRLSFGRGWSGLAHMFSPGDVSGDGRADVVAVDAAGRLWLYRGDGRGGFQPGRTQIGHGWHAFAQVVAGGDANRDGRADIVAVDRSGRLFAYYGNGASRFPASRQLGHGWSALRIHAVGGFDADGLDDFVAIAGTGAMLLYGGSATGWVKSGQQIGRGWSAMRLA